VAVALRIVPVLGILALLGSLYGLYLLYLGLPRLMKCPPERAAGYTVVVVVCAIVLSIVITLTGGAIAGIGMIGSGALTSAALGGVAGSAASGTRSGSSSEVQFDKDSALGKLQDLGKKLEESGKKIDAAEKSGDQNAQAAAALEGLGALLGGGKRVDPISIEQLKPFVPETFAGLAKKSSNSERTGLPGLMVSKSEATYGDDSRRATLEISDTGGVSGLVGLAGWVGVQNEQEDENGAERTRKVDGRLVHEKTSKRGGANEFGVVLGDRFVVSATGNGVDLNDLRAAVMRLDLGKLESMKNVGVQQ